MNFDPAPAAAALLAARRERRPAGPLPDAIAPRTEAEGEAVQAALAGLLESLPPAGFKIGATGATMQRYLGLTEPLGGFMRAADLHGDGAVLPWSGFRNVGVECEIAVRLGRDLPPGEYTADSVRGGVAELFPSVELVENRYGPPPMGDLKALGTPTLVADQMFHAAAVLGAPAVGWQATDLAAIEGRILVDGAERHRGLGRELLGHPLNALAWLAGSSLARAFGGLRAGQVVTLGSVTPPVWLEGPCRVRVEFSGLGAVEFALA